MHFLNGVSRATLYKIKQPSQKERYIQLSSSSSSRSDSVRLDTGQNPMLSWRHFIQGLGAIHTFWWPRNLSSFYFYPSSSNSCFFFKLISWLIKAFFFVVWDIKLQVVWLDVSLYFVGQFSISKLNWFRFSRSIPSPHPSLNSYSDVNADHNNIKSCGMIARFPTSRETKDTHPSRIRKSFGLLLMR